MMRKTVCSSAVIVVFLQLSSARAQDVDVPGNLTMVDSSSKQGNILKGGVLFLHNFGGGNTFLGGSAGNLTMTGLGNTGTGANALSVNSSGGSNTATGANALLGNTDGTAGTATGAGALANNSTGNDNTAHGHGALNGNTTGDGNTAVGNRALFANTIGSGNTAVGNSADASTGDLTNATAIGAGAIVDASNKIRLGDEQIEVIEGQVGFTSSSDRNRKENFRPVEGEEVLAKIRGLPLTSWNFIGQDAKRFRHYGPMAQDFFAAFGHDGVGTIGTPTTITSTDMDGILLIAAQALERRSVEQDKEIKELKARLEALEKLLDIR